MTENEWQRTVIDAAHAFRWKVAHFRPAMTAKGWRTPVQADGKGWPDLMLVRDRLIAVELKSDDGKLSDEQEEWLHRLRTAHIETYVWRPSDDWAGIVTILRSRDTRS